MHDEETRDEDELGENTFDASDFDAEEEIDDLEDAEADLAEAIEELDEKPEIEEEEEDTAEDFDTGYSEFNDYEK